MNLKTSNPLGEVTDGWINLKAPLDSLPVSDEPERDADRVPNWRAIRLRTVNGDLFGSHASFDQLRALDDETGAKVKSLELFALILRKSLPEKGCQDDETYASLIVAFQPETGRSKMCRVVYIFSQSAEIGEREVIEDYSNFPTVRLI